MSQAALREWIREGLQNPNKTRSGLARALGRHRSTVTKILDGSRELKAHEVELAANYLDAPPPVPGEPILTPNARRLDDAPDLPGDARRWPRDVPLFSSAQGGGFEDADEERRIEYDVVYGDGPTEYVARPPAIAQIKGLFAVRIRGDSMEPWRQHGDVVFVAPHRPVRPGDHVIVEIQRPGYSERRAVVKLLRARNERYVILGQYNPVQESIEVPLDQVISLYKVLEWREVFPIG